MELDRLLGRLSDAINDGIIITDAGGARGPLIVWCNAVFKDQTGYDPEEVVGKSPGLLQGPESDPEAIRRIGEGLRAWKPTREQILNYRKDGTTFWIDLSLVPVADADGWVHYWVGIQRDITELMRLKEQLQAATQEALGTQERLWSAIEAIPEAFSIYDEDDRIVVFNNRYRRLYRDSAPAIHIGATFEEVLRYGLERGQYPEAVGREEEWLQRRLERHRNPRGPIEQKLSRERYVRIHEVRTENGDMVGFRTDITELKRQKEKLVAAARELDRARQEAEKAALTDPLTGLGNRRALDALLLSLDEASHETAEASILHIDLDHFKSINDAFGHAAGDSVLTHVAQILRSSVRPCDHIARVGGDEFVIVLVATSGIEFAEGVAERIIRRCRAPIEHGDTLLHIGASIGIASGSASRASQLLNDADIALYEAKGEGRNRSAVFTPRLRAMAEGRKRLADELVRALSDDQIVPHFQPQVAADTRRLVGVEALVRWKRPDGGITDPAVFLPIAEHLGLMGDIDAIMLEKSFEMVRRMAAQGVAIPKVSVNVSFRRLADPTLCDRIGRAADRPCRVAFELLETIDFDLNAEALVWRLDDLRERGIEIEIDDFGSGRASITNLMKIRPERIKIDQQLVAAVECEGTEGSPIMKAIGEMARSLDIAMTAEGVETEAQARVLTRIGCDVLQGFLFARPLAEADLRRWIAGREAWTGAEELRRTS